MSDTLSRVRLRSALVPIGLVFALGACTTNLSYTYDAGGSSSGTSGSSGDGGGGAACPGAQFCDDFDQNTQWRSGWNVLDRVSGTTPGTAFGVPAVLVNGATKELQIEGLSSLGGWVYPTKTFHRNGPRKTLKLRVSLRFLSNRDGTFLSFIDPAATYFAHVAIRGTTLYVDTADVKGLVVALDSPTKLEVVIEDDGSNATTLKIPAAGFTRTITAAVPDDVEVRFGVTPFPDASSLPMAMRIALDDIVIE